MPVADGPEDTLCAVELMVQAGVEVIVVLGGDGTHRLVAMVCGATPVMALSTGTNNVFPKAHEATVAGIATGLVAGGLVSRTEVVRSNKVLHVDVNGVRRGLAVVDVSVSCERWIGAKALWRPEALQHIFIAFSEPGAVGLSSIAGLLRPISREAGLGLRVDLMPLAQAATVLMAPLAPGLIVPVGIGTVREIQPGATEIVQTPRGVIALDGERELEFMDTDRISVRLDRNGPFTIDLDRVMARAAQDGLLARSAIEVTRRT
jgi:predicted polyphosphate/ATP-dependent NAD kinase